MGRAGVAVAINDQRETRNVVSLEPAVLQIGEAPQDDVLLGSRCTSCSRLFFPQRAWCGGCAEPTTEVVELSREGMLTSYTRLHRKPEYGLIEPPYVLGEVTLPQGIRIYSIIEGLDEADATAVDIPVRLTTMVLREDDDGRAVLGYAFTPTGSA